MANVPVTAWDETTPSGNTKINKGDDYQREMKTQLREVISVDHEFASSGQTATTGQHKKVTLQEQADLGTGAVGTTILGNQTVSGKGELVYTDEDNNDVQITSSGYINTSKLKSGALPTGVTVASANIVNGTIVNEDINASAAISYSKLSIADADLTIAKTSGLQTALDSKSSKTYNYTETKSCAYATETTFTHNLGYIPMHIVIPETESNDNPCPRTSGVSTSTITIFNPTGTQNVTVYAW